jgi:hypothetical protein
VYPWLYHHATAIPTDLEVLAYFLNCGLRSLDDDLRQQAQVFHDIYQVDDGWPPDLEARYEERRQRLIDLQDRFREVHNALADILKPLYLIQERESA